MKRVACVALAALTISLAAGGLALSSPPEWGPGYRYCGTFTKKVADDTRYRMWVYAHDVRCGKAMRIERERWLGPKRRQTNVNGGTGATGYVLLKRFPGWRCTSGAGAGGCRKGRSSEGPATGYINALV